MSALKDFQNQHGSEWGGIVGTPAFAGALALAHRERLDKITALSDEEIANHGKIILSDLRGHLQYESVLLGLHEKKEFVFQQLPPEEYPDPAAEAREEAKRSGHDDEHARSSGAFTPSASGLSITQEIFPPAKKKRGRPPGKGKKKK